MSKFMDVMRIIKFILTKRKILKRVQKEILDVKEEIDKAKSDSRITKKELKKILIQVGEVNDIIIEELLGE